MSKSLTVKKKRKKYAKTLDNEGGLWYYNVKIIGKGGEEEWM